MFDYIIKDVMEVVGYLPIGILCGILAVAIYLVCVWHAGRKRHLDIHLSDGSSEIDDNDVPAVTSAVTHIWNSMVWFLLGVYLAVMFVTVFLSREPGSRQGDRHDIVRNLGRDTAGACICHREYTVVCPVWNIVSTGGFDDGQKVGSQEENRLGEIHSAVGIPHKRWDRDSAAYNGARILPAG